MLKKAMTPQQNNDIGRDTISGFHEWAASAMKKHIEKMSAPLNIFTITIAPL
jgi:hypothetical protein